VLPDPAAADHLFPSRATSPENDDDANVRASLAAFSEAPKEAGASGGPTTRGARESETPPRDKIGGGSRNTEGYFPVISDAAKLFFANPESASRIEDWSACDWMCAKVLGPYVRSHPNSDRAARALLHWARTENAPPFARRAALVSFVNALTDESESEDERRSPTGGDALFGDGFVAELAATCAWTLGIRVCVPGDGDGTIPGEVRRETKPASGIDARETDLKRIVETVDETVSARDLGETSDPTTDPEAWVRIGARWMVSLCARAMGRSDGGLNAFGAARKRKRKRTTAAATAAGGSRPKRKPKE